MYAGAGPLTIDGNLSAFKKDRKGSHHRRDGSALSVTFRSHFKRVGECAGSPVTCHNASSVRALVLRGWCGPGASASLVSHSFRVVYIP